MVKKYYHNSVFEYFIPKKQAWKPAFNLYF
jgi:hypothetical protein